ncbi:hypothetical protein [Sphingomonas plantiphila]|uniref:hypothetical protein n=1 Tax=Sphingomonas plantiphila TaxID=3163295 RepID=UPI0038B420E5
MTEKNGGSTTDDQEPLLPLMTLDDVSQRLQKFLEQNPSASLSTFDLPKIGPCHRIEKPWGDPTLAIAIPTVEDASFFASLNAVILPERLSALWHEDTKDLEIIWTALPLSESQIEVSGRKFIFQYSNKRYKCEFGPSSDRLKLMASLTMPLTNPSAS